MKRLICLVITVVMVLTSFSVIAGGQQEAAAGKKGSDVVIGISNSLYGNIWRERMIEDMEKVAQEYIDRGMLKKLVIQHSGPDVQVQIQQIRNMIAEGVDFILINPSSASGLSGVIEEAKDEGIPSILFDAELLGKDRELAISVASDKFVEAYGAMSYVAEKIGGKGNVVLMLGNAAYQPTQKRHEGAKAVFKDYPGLNLLTTVYGEWNQATAEAVMNDVVAAYDDIDAVFTIGSMGMGALRAFENAGRPLPAITGDPTYEFCLYAEKQRDMGKEFIFACPGNPPGIGATALRIAVYLSNGYEFDTSKVKNNVYLYPVETLITPENLDDYLTELKGQDPSTWISEYASDELIQTLFK